MNDDDKRIIVTKSQKHCDEVYFHFDPKLSRLELRENLVHGEMLWMKKVHSKGELKKAATSAVNFARVQHLRIVEQSSRKVEQGEYPSSSEVVVIRVKGVAGPKSETSLRFEVQGADGSILLDKYLSLANLTQSAVVAQAKEMIHKLKQVIDREGWTMGDVFVEPFVQNMIGKAIVLESHEATSPQPDDEPPGQRMQWCEECIKKEDYGKGSPIGFSICERCGAMRSIYSAIRPKTKTQVEESLQSVVSDEIKRATESRSV